MIRKNFIFYMFYMLVVASLFYGVVISDFRVMFISTFTLVLYLICLFSDKIFGFKTSFFLKFLIYLFLFCSLILGEIFSFYSDIYFWDNILHFLSGVITSYFGILIINRLVRNVSISKFLFIICFLFTFCFSITVGVMWEFVEFGFDKYLGCDMQKDTYITSFNTVSLGDKSIVSVDNIVKTDLLTDKGVVATFDGYLDVGLVDTISDLLMNVCSAFIISLIGCFIIFKGFNFRLIFNKKET